MTDEELASFKQAYADVPSQDNEGYVPERGSFKAGFAAGMRWEREACAKIADSFINSPGYMSKLEIDSAYVNSTARDIAQAIRARGKQ